MSLPRKARGIKSKGRRFGFFFKDLLYILERVCEQVGKRGKRRENPEAGSLHGVLHSAGAQNPKIVTSAKVKSRKLTQVSHPDTPRVRF